MILECPRIAHGIMKQIAQRAGRKFMLRKLVIGALGAMAVLFSTTAFAQGTAAEAKAMLDKAVAAVKADKTKALDMFNKGEGGFWTAISIRFASTSAMARSLPSPAPMQSNFWGRILGTLRTAPARCMAQNSTPRRRSRKVKSVRSATCFQGP